MTVKELDSLNESNYSCPRGEEQFYHVVVEVKQFHSKTGARISRPRLQKFGRKVFDSVVRQSLIDQGYDMKILHNPIEWEKTGAKERANAEQALAAAKRNEEKERIKAEVIAELKASGMFKGSDDGEKAEKAEKKGKK